MSRDLSLLAKTIIDRASYAVLATTSSDGDPWNTPVFFAHDMAPTIYWGSHRKSQHSQNINANKKVFIVIYDATAVPGTGEGVYIRAVGGELSDSKEIAYAHNLLMGKRGSLPYWSAADVQDNKQICLYKAMPSIVWVNDEQESDGIVKDIRIEVKLG